jgi:hypothetical protein
MKLPNRFLPLWGVILDDWRQGVRHWAIAWWGILSLMLGVVWFIESPSAPPAPSSVAAAGEGGDQYLVQSGTDELANVQGPRASTMAAKTLRLHLLVWATLVIALAGSSIAAESEIVGDSILSRGVSRWQYYLGKVIGRVSLTVAAFIVFTLPLIILSLLKCHNDLSLAGLWGAMVQGSLLLAGVAAISVSASAWFRNPLLAVAVSWMVVYGFAIVVSIMQIDSVSPLRFIESVMAMPRRPDVVMTATSLLSTLGLGVLGANLVSLVGYSRRDF